MRLDYILMNYQFDMIIHDIPLVVGPSSSNVRSLDADCPSIIKNIFTILYVININHQYISILT
jgi:hypothetical protein